MFYASYYLSASSDFLVFMRLSLLLLRNSSGSSLRLKELGALRSSPEVGGGRLSV